MTAAKTEMASATLPLALAHSHKLLDSADSCACLGDRSSRRRKRKTRPFDCVRNACLFNSVAILKNKAIES